MPLKDLIGFSLLSLCLFPLLLLGMLLGTGVVHMEMGTAQDRERLRESFHVMEVARQDSAEAAQLKAFKALEGREKEINEREEALHRETERLEALKIETLAAKEEIAAHRRRIESWIAQSENLQDKQIASLAEVYGGMKADEAAPILLSLKDSVIVRILRKVPETRATSKMMAAIGALDLNRAARITELLGRRPLPDPEPKAKSSGKTAAAAGAKP